MSRDFSEAVRRNLLSNSIEKRLPQAFTEWSFTGATKDYRDLSAICQLCEHEELRYHFEIRNYQTNAKLWVGSQCILKFGVAVYDGDELLSPTDARKKLNSLIAEMRLKACISALEELARKEDNAILKSALKYYKEHNYLTPKFGFVVLWRLAQNRIDHSPSFFKISLKREKYRNDLAAMEPSRVHIIWPALSSAQRRVAEELGHAPPPAAAE